MSFDPWNSFLKFWESTGTLTPKVGVTLGVWGFTPSHFLTLSGSFLAFHPCGLFALTPGLPLGPQPCNPLCLGCEPKARVATVILRWLSTNCLYLEILFFLKNTYFLVKNMKQIISTIAPFLNIMPNGKPQTLKNKIVSKIGFLINGFLQWIF